MSNRYFGGILSATKISTNGTAYTGAASGVWNIVQHARAQKASAWPKGQGIYAPLDPPVSLITTGNQTITVTYSPPSDNGGSAILSYTVVAVSATTPFTTITTTEPASVTTTTLYGVSNGVSYNVYVYATNVYGNTLNYTTYFARQVPVLTNNDANYASTALILTGNETNNNSQFADSSPLNNVVVKYGSPVISTSRFIEGFASMYFDGVSSYITYDQVFRNITSVSTAFTIEFWWYPTSVVVNNGAVVMCVTTKSTGAYVVAIGANYYVSTATIITGITQITLNSWQHIALTSNGTSLYLYINGVLINTTSRPTTALSNCNLSIGANNITPDNFAPGWVDSFRVTSGVARYTSSFTPSASITGYNLPVPPTNVSASVGAGQSIISFTPSVFNGSVVTSYKVISIPGQITVTGPSSPITVNELVNGTLYQFRVIATNVNGSSAASNPSNIVQPNPPTIPSAPTITSVAFGNTAAIITFNLPVNLGGSACTYTATSTPGNITAPGNTSPITVPGLTNGTSYTFTVTATNSTGTGDSSNVSEVVIPATVPDPPTITNVTSFDKTATITFTPSANNNGDAAYSFTVATGNITATGSSSPITITGLTNGVSYTFTVTATNKAGNSIASIVSAGTTPLPPLPVAPTLTLSSITSTLTKSITLSWNVDPICTYQLYDSNNNALSGITSSGQTITKQYDNSVFLSTQTYSFYVIATNLKGSAISNTLQVTIPKQVITLSLAVQPDYVSGTGACIINSASYTAAGWDLANQALPATVSITLSGDIAGSVNPYNTALTMDFSVFHTTTTVAINNIPRIAGYGGAGGARFSGGGSGGTGMSINSNCAVYLGTFMPGVYVNGGGGGGGGAGAYGGTGGAGLVLYGAGPYTIKYPTNFLGGGGGGSCPAGTLNSSGTSGSSSSGSGGYGGDSGTVYGRPAGGSAYYPQGSRSYTWVGGTSPLQYNYNGGDAIQGTTWTQG
jgi:hypothetical protein